MNQTYAHRIANLADALADALADIPAEKRDRITQIMGEIKGNESTRLIDHLDAEPQGAIFSAIWETVTGQR